MYNSNKEDIVRKISIPTKEESFITIMDEFDDGYDTYQIHRRKSGFLLTCYYSDGLVTYKAYLNSVDVFNELITRIGLENKDRLPNLNVIHEIFNLLVC